MRVKESILFLSVVFSVFLVSGQGLAQERIALVIGNSSYEHATALPNPKNDAVAISDALQDVGFEVTVNIDLDQRSMQAALRDFGLKAETADIALVYFAGHGIQVANQNYLLPTDAQLRRERDLIYEATPLSVVTAEVAQARQLGMVILDACRDNPLAENLRQSLGPVRSKLIGLGMARVEDVPPDTLIAFSTRFNQLAYDGAGSLSPFTTALVDHIREPGLELNLFFRKVRDSVLELTANRQEPRTLDALGAKPFYFTAPKSNQAPQLGDIKPLVVEDGAGAVNAEIATPRDPDNDDLSIEVMGLPSSGTLKKADETAIKFGDELTVAELSALAYQPTQGETGSAGAFLFVVRDGQGGVKAGRLPIDVIRSNKVPVVADVQDVVWPKIPLNIDAPTDPDGDPMDVTVVAVPSLGVVTRGDQTVTVGDKLSIEELTALMLDPADGVAGTFTYEVADDHGGVSTSSIRLQPPLGGEVAPVAGQQADPSVTVAATTPQARNTERQPVEDTAATIPSSAATGSATVETRTASNIRNAPGTNARWLTAVPAGTRLKLIREVQDQAGTNWYQIETVDGTAGFISSSLVIETDTQRAALDQGEQVAPAAPAPTTELAAVNPQALALDDNEFVDCEACPVMVSLPTGRFDMGSPDGDRSEQPVRSVSIAAPLAIGKYEVTVAQWQACASAGFCRDIGSPGQDDAVRPVQNISWADAETFLAWLKSETGETYRLPSEAEWEYAARGGSSTRYWWGDSFEDGRANCAECGEEWDRKKPANIGFYDANPFGLHGMNGGVSEWVADCWIADYQDAPSDGTVRSLSFCPQRVLRGGSWRSEQDEIASSSRFRYDAQVRYYTNGFRVARDLN